METWFPRFIIALWLIATFSPTLGGSFERAAFAVIPAWLGLISNDNYMNFALNFHW